MVFGKTWMWKTTSIQATCNACETGRFLGHISDLLNQESAFQLVRWMALRCKLNIATLYLWERSRKQTAFLFLLAGLHAQSLSPVQLFVTPWAVAHQAPLSMEFSKQKYWSGLPFLTPENLPNPGIEPASPAFSALAGGFFTTELPGKPCLIRSKLSMLI